MHLFILFGLPGAGKTFVGKLLEERYGAFFYEGDDSLTQEMKDAIKTKTPFTDSMRDVFFTKLISKIQQLSAQHPYLVVSQTFIKEKYRQALIASLPHAQFVLITADTKIRELRLQNRVAYPLELTYSRTMVANFEKPCMPYHIIDNNQSGINSLERKLDSLVCV